MYPLVACMDHSRWQIAELALEWIHYKHWQILLQNSTFSNCPKTLSVTAAEMVCTIVASSVVGWSWVVSINLRRFIGGLLFGFRLLLYLLGPILCSEKHIKYTMLTYVSYHLRANLLPSNIFNLDLSLKCTRYHKSSKACVQNTWLLLYP